MKKQILAATLLVMALGLAACSPKNAAEATSAEATTSAAATEAPTTTAEETTTAEDVEEASVDGLITKLDGDIVTIQNSEDDKEVSFDIGSAEIIGDYDLSAGDEVEIIFAEGATGDIIPAISLEVYTSVIEENSDPSVEGTIEDAANNTIALKTEDGEIYTFSKNNSYIVSKDGIKTGINAKITYLGDLEDTDPIPMAIKVVTEDSYDSKEAKVSAFYGTIGKLDGNNFVAETEEGNYFSCTAEDGVKLSGIKEGDKVLISYSGPLTAKVVSVSGVEK